MHILDQEVIVIEEQNSGTSSFQYISTETNASSSSHADVPIQSTSTDSSVHQFSALYASNPHDIDTLCDMFKTNLTISQITQIFKLAESDKEDAITCLLSGPIYLVFYLCLTSDFVTTQENELMLI